jgi:hypothetical protein
LMVIESGREIVRGTDLQQLRRRCAAAARAELERRARAVYGVLGPWRRFEAQELPITELLQLE